MGCIPRMILKISEPVKAIVKSCLKVGCKGLFVCFLGQIKKSALEIYRRGNKKNVYKVGKLPVFIVLWHTVVVAEQQKGWRTTQCVFIFGPHTQKAYGKSAKFLVCPHDTHSPVLVFLGPALFPSPPFSFHPLKVGTRPFGTGFGGGKNLERIFFFSHH